MSAGYAPGDEPVPNYRLIEFLGRGGFGEVWKASAPGGAHAALKMIALDGKRGAKEFRALQLVKHIRHPNLVQVTAFWMKDATGRILDEEMTGSLTLADVEGPGAIQETMDADAIPAMRGAPTELIIAMGLGDKSLSDRLAECQQQRLAGIPPEELLEYMDQAARAIDFLNSPRHDLGEGPVAIQHRDIKPQNMLIVGDAVQLCDFGLARALSDITVTQFAGSPAYSAPECLDGNRVSGTTDQYSLAITYIELRSGVLPFDDDSLMGVINAHVQGKLNLSRLPPAERAVIEKATSLQPDHRYPLARAMVRALRAAYEEPENAAGEAKTAGAGKNDPHDAASSSILLTMPQLDEAVESRDTADELARATVADSSGRGIDSAIAGSAAPPLPERPGRRLPWAIAVSAVVVAMLAAVAWRLPRGGSSGEPKAGIARDGENVSSSSSQADPVAARTPLGQIQDIRDRLQTAGRALRDDAGEAFALAGAALKRLDDEVLAGDESVAPLRLELRRSSHLLRARAAARLDHWDDARAEIQAFQASGEADQGERSVAAALIALVDVEGDPRLDRLDPSRWLDLRKHAAQARQASGEGWLRDELAGAQQRLAELLVGRADALLKQGDSAAAATLLEAIVEEKEVGRQARLLLAECRLHGGDVEGGLSELDRIDAAKLDQPLEANFAALTATARLRQPMTSAKTLAAALGEAADSYRTLPLIRGGSVTDRLTRELLKAVKTRTAAATLEASVRDELIDLLAVVEQRVTQRLVREQARQQYADLLTTRIRSRIESTAPPDFAAQLRDCEAADRALVSDGLITAAWAEALVENRRNGPATDQVFADDLQVSPGDQAYVQYVRLRVLSNSGQGIDSPLFRETLAHLIPAFGQQPLPSGLQLMHRQLQTARVYLKRVRALRRKIGGDPIAALLERPFADRGSADVVFGQLRNFDRLLDDIDEIRLPLDTNLVLAAWYRSPREADLARSLAGELVSGEADLGEDRLPVLRVSAESLAAAAQDSPARQAAIAAYRRLVEEIFAHRAVRDLDDEIAVRLMRQIIEPALAIEISPADLPEAARPSLASDLAYLFAARGGLLAERLYADWGEVDLVELRRRRYEAFDRSVNYATIGHGIVPSYLTGRGQARIALAERPDQDTLNQAEQDAVAALKSDHDDPAANSLLALVYRYRASEVASRDPKRVVELMQKAESLCRKAVDHGGEPRIKARYLTDLSNVYLWWANFTSDVDQKQPRLEQAIDNARQALEIDSTSEDAHRAWGNAAEDLAWIVARVKQDSAMADRFYDVALEHHEEATRLHPRKAKTWFDFGRAALRSVTEHYHDTPQASPVESADEAISRLEVAHRALSEATRLDPSLDQAYYFLGLVDIWLGKPAQAGNRFAQAVEIGVKDHRREVSYTSQWARVSMSVLSGVAFEMDVKHAKPDIDPATNLARSAASALDALPEGVGAAWYSDPKKEAVALASTADAMRGNTDEALKRLDAALPKDRDPDVTEINLLVARAYGCMASTERWKSDASFRGRALLDAQRAYALAVKDRGAITATRRLTAAEMCALLAHRLSKRRDDPDALRAKSRDAARQLLTLLVNNPLMLYHPHAWMWRQALADTLIDELLESDQANPREQRRLADEIRGHLNFAEKMGAERSRIRLLREDLAKALSPPPK